MLMYGLKSVSIRLIHYKRLRSMRCTGSEVYTLFCLIFEGSFSYVFVRG